MSEERVRRWRGKATVKPDVAQELRKVGGFLQAVTGRPWGTSKTVEYLIEVWKKYEYPELSQGRVTEVLRSFLPPAKGEEEAEGSPEG